MSHAPVSGKKPSHCRGCNIHSVYRTSSLQIQVTVPERAACLALLDGGFEVTSVKAGPRALLHQNTPRLCQQASSWNSIRVNWPSDEPALFMGHDHVTFTDDRLRSVFCSYAFRYQTAEGAKGDNWKTGRWGTPDFFRQETQGNTQKSSRNAREVVSIPGHFLEDEKICVHTEGTPLLQFMRTAVF